MLRVGKLTDYATVLMTCLAQAPDEILGSVELAARVRLEPPTVSKVLKALAAAGLVESFRGASGGYRLARAPGDITVADIVAAMEGPIAMTECSAHRGACHHESHCDVQVNWRRISTAIETALRSVSLADMAPRVSPKRRIPLRVVAQQR